MTRQWNNNGAATPFSHWLRSLPSPLDSQRISNHNIDYVWHNYRDNWLLTIEEKRFGSVSSKAQRDTHHVVAQMLAASDGMLVSTLRGVRPVRYLGHFEIAFENTTPDDGWIRINGVEVSRRYLVSLLSGGLRVAA